MAVAKTLIYYDTATILSMKNFIVQAPGNFLTLQILDQVKNPARVKTLTFWHSVSNS
jgi:hypothetical protein